LPPWKEKLILQNYKPAMEKSRSLTKNTSLKWGGFLREVRPRVGGLVDV
jgi:hypothetical protein